MKKGLLLVLIGMSLLLSGCAKTATPEVEDETVDTPTNSLIYLSTLL